MVECQVRKVSQRGGRRTWSRLLWKVRTKSWLFRLASGGPVMALLGSFDGVVKAKVWLNGFRLKGKRGNSKYRQPTNEAFSCKTMQRNEDAHLTHLMVAFGGKSAGRRLEWPRDERSTQKKVRVDQPLQSEGQNKGWLKAAGYLLLVALSHQLASPTHRLEGRIKPFVDLKCKILKTHTHKKNTFFPKRYWGE